MGLGCQILDIHIHSAAKQGNVPAHSGKPAPLGGSFLDHKNKDKKKQEQSKVGKASPAEAKSGKNQTDKSRNTGKSGSDASEYNI